MIKLAILSVLVGVGLTIVADRPERKPGNLTPIQLISAAGVWALVLANVPAVAIGIRDGSFVLCASATATLAVALFLFVRDEAGAMSPDAPDAVKRVVEDLRQLFGGAPRLGMDSLAAVVVVGNCPGIGVAVRPQGRVLVRVRRDVAQWLERHQHAGGAGAAVIASFARFTVLHELGHVLNGDHRTFRFVRAVLLAHIVWIAGAITAIASTVSGRAASISPIAVALSIVALFVVQSLVARRFIAERERLADWRAMQTLAPADAAQLLERRGRRTAVPNPTQLEKLMIDLKAQVPPDTRGPRWWSQLITLVWAEGDDIQRRVAHLAGDRIGDPPKPVLWAALIGMQCGLLSGTMLVAVMCAAAPWPWWSRDLAEPALLVIVAWMVTPAATFCQLRIDPGRMSVREVRRANSRVVVAVVFCLAFSASALALHRFQVRFAIESMPREPVFFAVLLMAAFLVGIGAWMGLVAGGGDGGGELDVAPRSDWVRVYPLLARLALVLVPAGIAVSHAFGLGPLRSWRWAPLVFLSFGAYVVSTAMARSTSTLLQTLAPMAMLDTPAPVYGVRIFWRDFYIDLSRTPLTRAAAIAIAMQLVALPFFVIPAGLVMRVVRTVLTARATFVTVFLGGMAVFLLVLIIPDRYRAYGGASARLLDGSRLQLFVRLLAAARVAGTSPSRRLETALARWLRDEHFPNAVLPDARAVWPLASLRSLVHIAREVGELAALERWRNPIERALRTVIENNAVAVAPGQPPSLHWTVLAATILDEAGLRDAFAFERMLDHVERLLDERLTHGMDNLLTDVIAACRLLHAHGRSGADTQRMRRVAHASSLVTKPSLRQSLAELCDLADITGDTELREKLAPIVRSRSWEVLQLNPRKEVLLLLDCYLAAAFLGETDARHAAAGVIVGELSDRVSTELMTVVNGRTAHR